VLEEIAGRVRVIQDSGCSVLPPVLLLGVMERVGSNWVSDTLRPVTGPHNEPFRQQVGPAHPLSSLNPGMSPDDTALRLGPYGQHWPVAFAVGEYAPVRQLINSLIAANLWRDCERSRRWTAALLRFLTEADPANRGTLQRYLTEWAPRGHAMLAAGGELLARPGGRPAGDIAAAAAKGWTALLEPAGLTADQG
jgi:hypothetical protein